MSRKQFRPKRQFSNFRPKGLFFWVKLYKTYKKIIKIYRKPIKTMQKISKKIIFCTVEITIYALLLGFTFISFSPYFLTKEIFSFYIVEESSSIKVPIGSLARVDPRNRTLSIGDIIGLNVTDGGNMKVVQLDGIEQEGEIRLLISDDSHKKSVLASDVKGKIIMHYNYLGTLAAFLRTKWGLTAVGLLLFANYLYFHIGEIRKRIYREYKKVTKQKVFFHLSGKKN